MLCKSIYIEKDNNGSPSSKAVRGFSESLITIFLYLMQFGRKYSSRVCKRIHLNENIQEYSVHIRFCSYTYFHRHQHEYL